MVTSRPTLADLGSTSISSSASIGRGMALSRTNVTAALEGRLGSEAFPSYPHSLSRPRAFYSTFEQIAADPDNAFRAHT